MKKLLAFLYFGLLVAANLLPLSLAQVRADAPNLIANPSAETADPANPNLPQNWLQGGWGTNSTAFTYPNSGHTGSRSLEVQINSYSSGDAKWYFTPVAVTAGTEYTFSDYYESNIASDLVAQFDDGNGNYAYSDLGAQAASSSWKLAAVNLTIPSGEKNLTVFHLINSVGWLQTDDYSLSAYTAPSAPSVSLTSPAANTAVSGSVQLSASASDSNGIAGVQFQVDGSNVGSEVTGAPYQLNWDSTTVSNGSHSLTAVARNTNNVTTVSSPVQVTVNNPVAPGTNLIANPSFETPSSANPNQPAGWSQGGWGTNSAAFTYITNGGRTGTHSAQVQISSYTSGDAKWYFAPVPVTAGSQYTYSDYYQSNVSSDITAQFDDGNGKYAYVDLGITPASVSWKQASVNFTVPAGMKNLTIFHLISGVGSLQIDDVSLSAPTVPTVSVSAPAANSTVSGTVQLAATASAPAGVKSVQFKVDGSNQGPALTASPYQTAWDTTKLGNGSHTLTAVVTDNNNQTAASAPVSVNVSNQAAGANLVPNPSLETADPSNSKLPLDWTHGSWGSNTATFTYLTSGHTGKRSIKTQISSYTSGAAYWYSNNMPVAAGQMYDYSDYYKSSVTSEIDAGFTMSDGSEQDIYLGDAFESPNSWTQFDTQFTVPAGAVAVTFYHNIYSAGWLQTDDYSLTNFTYQGFNRPIVSLDFDDGYESFYQYGLPLLQKYGFGSTDFIISGYLGATDYMTAAQVNQLQADGQEIGSHTVDHPDLTTLSATKLDQELKNSQITLQSLLGVPVKDLATPYGAANNQVITDAKKYYSSVRGVEAGYNAKNNFSPYNILVQDVVVTTPISQVEQWIQQAQATNTWLVLVYHQVDPTLTDETAQPYNTYPGDLDAELAYLQSTHIAVETNAQALAEITPQLGAK